MKSVCDFEGEEKGNQDRNFGDKSFGIQISCISSCGSVSESGETPVGSSVGNRAFWYRGNFLCKSPPNSQSAEIYVAIYPVFYVINVRCHYPTGK